MSLPGMAHGLQRDLGHGHGLWQQDRVLRLGHHVSLLSSSRQQLLCGDPVPIPVPIPGLYPPGRAVPCRLGGSCGRPTQGTHCKAQVGAGNTFVAGKHPLTSWFWFQLPCPGVWVAGARPCAIAPARAQVLPPAWRQWGTSLGTKQASGCSPPLAESKMDTVRWQGPASLSPVDCSTAGSSLTITHGTMRQQGPASPSPPQP